MLDWQVLSQQLQQIINTVIRFIKVRRREEATIGLAAILIWLGYSSVSWLSPELKDFLKGWNGHLIIPGIFFVAGGIFLSYGIYRIWKLVYIEALPPPANRPSAIKGPQAFTPADGELFRKLGREDELRKLLGYIEDDQVRLVVLMGASGAGKTSLLRAGLTDILKDRDFKYHYWEVVQTEAGRGLLSAIKQSLNSQPNNADENQTESELDSLDDLVNPSPQFGKHVIVLDQFEQLGSNIKGPIFDLLRKVARKSKPPNRITWIIAFRREYRASWSDFMIPEHERGFYPPELSLRLFAPQQARDVISQLIQAADLSVEQKVVDNLIEAATLEGEVSSVDIGIGLLVLSELYERHGAKTLTEDVYYFAGGAEGLLTQYVDRCLNNFPEEDRKTLMSALLALRDPETNQRIAQGKTCDELAAEIEVQNVRRLEIQFERLTQRDIRLLEPVAVSESKDVRYRLPHERLIPAISRLAGKLIGELEEAKIKFGNAFSAWKHNKSRQYLLKGKVLRMVER